MFFIFLSLLAFADPDCEKHLKNKVPFNENWVWQPMYSASEGICSVTLMPKTNGFRRGFNFNDNGAFVVSVSNPEGMPQIRHYFIYPPTTPLSETSLNRNNDKFNLTHPSGLRVDFDISKANSVRFPQCKTKIEPLEGFKNQGGFEIEKCEGRLVFDIGFGKGPIEDPERLVKIMDQNGLSCKVPVRELFEYQFVINPRTKSKQLSGAKYRPQREIVRVLQNGSKHPDCARLDLIPILGEPTGSPANKLGHK